MPDPILFAEATPRAALPLLHSGQTQKDVFVNEALSRIDNLMHCVVYGKNATPAENSVEGETWLIADEAMGAWAGREGQLATWNAGNWTFLAPFDGLRVFNAATAQEYLYFGGWRKAELVGEPVGGERVDGEARAVINELISALQALGILPSA